MIFKEHLSQEQGFSDLLNYAHFVEDGVIINKDGAFMKGFRFRGPDINSATTGELDALTNRFSRMQTFLDDGWMIHVDEIRIPSLTYPKKGFFPDPVSALIDEERRTSLRQYLCGLSSAGWRWFTTNLPSVERQQDCNRSCR